MRPRGPAAPQASEKGSLFPLYKLGVVYIDIVLIIPADPRADP